MKKYFIRAISFFLIISITSAMFISCTGKTDNPDIVIPPDDVMAVKETENKPGYNDKPAIIVPQSAINSPTDKWLYDSPKNHNINDVVFWELEDRMAEYVEFNQSGGGTVLTARDGYIVYENNEDSFNYTFTREIWSLTKSFVSALIGIAIDEGYIKSVDDKVLDYFKDWDIDNIDDMKKAMTIKDVLTMRSGLAWNNENKAANWVESNSNPVLTLLSMEMEAQPGTEWKYNTAASSILTAIIQQATGKTAFEYAKEKLFIPLGITVEQPADDLNGLTVVKWGLDKAGINFGGFGLQMLPQDLLKFGQLFLNNGMWDGKQIISGKWIKESTACDIPANDGADLYGYHWWGVRGVEAGEYLLDSAGYSITLKEAIQDGEIYRATGYGGQYIYVWPKYNIVVVIQNVFYTDIYSDMSVWGKYDSDIGNNIFLVDVLASINEAVEYTENPESKSLKREITPEATGNLVIYASPYNDYIMNAALKIYKKQYPNVEVNYVEFADQAEYFEKLKTEVMAGKGPDLWFGFYYEFPDIFKTADSGIFEDLSEYMKNDHDIYWGDYNKTALDAGIYKGEQIFMPIAYSVRVLLTTEEIMQEEQINFSELNSYQNLMKAIRKFQQKYTVEGKCLFRDVRDDPFADQNYTNYFPWSGIQVIDYETGNVINDSEVFRETMDAMKWAIPIKPGDGYTYGSTFGEALDLKDKHKLFGKFENFAIRDLPINYGVLLHYAKPLYMPMRDIDGKVTAAADLLAGVFKNSENKENAYNFIKILLSEKIQSDDMYWQISVPVLKSAVEARFDKVLQNMPAEPYKYPADEYNPEFYQDPTPTETVLEIKDMLMNIDRCAIRQTAAFGEFWGESFDPYFAGEKTYEECFAAFKNSLELYASE